MPTVLPNFQVNPLHSANQPTSEEIIGNAWKEAHRLMDVMRSNHQGITFKITEIQGNEENSDHHIVIVADGCGEAAIIRAEMSAEFSTRFLMLPGLVVRAIQNS